MTKDSGIKSPLPMCTVVPRVPNFHPFRSAISRFQDIALLDFFYWTPLLKFQSTIKFLNFGKRKKLTLNIYHNFLFPNDYLIYHLAQIGSELEE